MRCLAHGTTRFATTRGAQHRMHADCYFFSVPDYDAYVPSFLVSLRLPFLIIPPRFTCYLVFTFIGIPSAGRDVAIPAAVLFLNSVSLFGFMRVLFRAFHELRSRVLPSTTCVCWLPCAHLGPTFTTYGSSGARFSHRVTGTFVRWMPTLTTCPLHLTPSVGYGYLADGRTSAHQRRR